MKQGGLKDEIKRKNIRVIVDISNIYLTYKNPTREWKRMRQKKIFEETLTKLFITTGYIKKQKQEILQIYIGKIKRKLHLGNHSKTAKNQKQRKIVLKQLIEKNYILSSKKH